MYSMALSYVLVFSFMEMNGFIANIYTHTLFNLVTMTLTAVVVLLGFL